MKTNTRLILGLLLAALMITAASAQQGRGWRQGDDRPGLDRGPEMRLERLAERLDLSDEQKEAIEAIEDQARQDGIELRKEKARLQNQLHGLMLEDDPGTGEVTALIEKIGDVRTELQKIRMKARLDIRAQLTDEQRDQMMLMRRGGRGGFGGPRGFGGPGGDCDRDCDGPHGHRGQGRHGRDI